MLTCCDILQYDGSVLRVKLLEDRIILIGVVVEIARLCILDRLRLCQRVSKPYLKDVFPLKVVLDNELQRLVNLRSVLGVVG